MPLILRMVIAVVTVGVLASACGSAGGGSGSSAQVVIQAGVRRGVCLPVHPGLSPYRGSLVLVRSDGRRTRVGADSRGHGRTALAPGGYRLVPPLPGSTVHVDLNGRAVAVAGHGYPLRIAAGATARLAVVILPRRGECSSSGAGA
jgi:hypothetical protein